MTEVTDVERALCEFIYGTTRLSPCRDTLSPCRDDGSHDRRISAETLERVRAALSAIPIPAPTGEVERAIVAYLDAFDNGTGTVYVEPLMRAARAALSDHTTKGAE